MFETRKWTYPEDWVFYSYGYNRDWREVFIECPACWWETMGGSAVSHCGKEYIK